MPLPPTGSSSCHHGHGVMHDGERERGKYADEWLHRADAANGYKVNRTDSFGLSRMDSFCLDGADGAVDRRREDATNTHTNTIAKFSTLNSTSQVMNTTKTSGSLKKILLQEGHDGPQMPRRLPSLSRLVSSHHVSTLGRGGGRSNLRVRFNLETEEKPPSLLFSPHDPFVIWWKHIEVLFLAVSFFRLPMVMAFGAEYLIWDIAPELYFSFDHLLTLNTAFYRKDDLIMDRQQIVNRWFDFEHFKTGDRGSVYVFLMEFFPFYCCIATTDFFRLPFWVLSLSALPRCRRINDLMDFFYQRERDLTKDVRWTALFKYTLALLGSGHWFACLWWLLARVSNFSDNSWLRQYLGTVKRDIAEELNGELYSYSISLLWGYSTLSGVGYLGYLPSTTLESIFYVGMTLVSVLVSSFLFGILLHYIVRKDVAQEKYKSLMDQVEKYATMYNLPRKLEDAMKLFYTFQYKKKVGADEEVMGAIPTPLKMKIMVHQYHLIASDYIFSGCQDQFVSTVLSLLKPKILTPGTQIYRKDDVSREVCFIERGEVEVTDKNDKHVGVLKVTDDCFPAVGEVAFFLGIPQVYTFTASNKSDVRLLTLSKEDYEEVKDRFPDARDILINNVRSQVFVGKEGEDVDHQMHDENNDSAVLELRKTVKEALRTKLDDDVATMFNAIRDGYYDEVKILLSKGFNTNATDYDKRTSLHFAAVVGDDKIVDLLLQHGADQHLQDRWGRTAFQDAVDYNHKKVIQQLAAHGAELILDNAGVRLCNAAFADNLFELQHLVENGIDANSADYDKRTALHLSACEGNSKIVEFLLLPMSKGDPNVTDRWGTSPLLDAIRHGNQAVARILHENGARLSIERAASFLNTAAAEGDCSMLILLSECGINTNLGDYDNRYPIHLAAAEGEVVSVHFLAYTHANVSVKDRWGRTPLDDAITGKFWMCAKLLLGFGAQHTVPLTKEAQEAIAKTCSKKIRELVRSEKDMQQKGNDTEKQLRDNVKWLIGDSETWLHSLEERIEQLARIEEKYMNGMEDEDQVAKEAGKFLDQDDRVILVSERPQEAELGIISDPENYLLDRYFKETTASHSHHSRVHGQPRLLRSMAQFFFRLLAIEKALSRFKGRIQEMSGSLGPRPSISPTTLGKVLETYGIVETPEELQRFINCCTQRRDGSRDGLLELEEGDNDPHNRATFHDLLTSLPLWRMVACIPVLEMENVPSDLIELQESIQCVFEGFDMLDRDGSGRMNRTEWRIMKRETDLGDFATAMDKYMEDHETMAIDIFFLVVAYWSGLEDDENVDMFCVGSDHSEGATVSTEGSFRPELSTWGKGKRPGMFMEGKYYGRPHMTQGSPNRSHFHDADLHAIVAVDHSDHGSDTADYPILRFKDLSLWARARLAVKLRLVHRWLARQPNRDVMPSVEEVAQRFDRLDTHGRGALDESRAQLLLSWALDVDFKPQDWEVVYCHLAGKDSCLVRRAAVLDWVKKILRQVGPRRESRLVGYIKQVTAGIEDYFMRQAAEHFLVDHRGKFAKFMEVMRVVTGIYMFMTVPYQICFLRRQLLTTYFPSLMVSWCFDLLMVLDIIIKFNTSYVENSVRVLDRTKIRNRYLRTSFVLDFIAVIPMDFLVAKYDHAHGSSPVAWLRLTKVLHWPKIYQKLQRKTQERYSASARLLADIHFLYFVAMALIHVLACVWYFMTEAHEDYSIISGYSILGEPTGGDDRGGPYAIRYYMYCVGVVVYVISSGGMPTNITGALAEVWFLTLVNVLNLSFWGYLMGSIAGLFISLDEQVAESHEQMSSCERFIKQNNIPADLGHELKTFFSLDANQKSSLTLSEQNRVYRNLPQSIQVELAHHTSRDLLLQVDIFRNASDYFLDAVSTLLQVDIIAPGEYLFLSGSVCRSLIIISSGIVETVKLEAQTQHWTVQGTHEAGEALGQLEFSLDTRYLTSARVAPGGDVLRVFRLQKEDYIRVLKLYPKDEDIIHQNVAGLSADDDKHANDAASVARSAHSATSYNSLESNLRSIMNDESHLDRAMQDIDKAKMRSQEQRIRSFCNAALHGDLDVLARLVNSGVDVNGRDANGRTALMLATCAGHIEVLKYLIFKGADPNLKDKCGGSALLDAIKGNHTEVMALLKEQGAVLQLEDAAGTLCSMAAEGKTQQLRLLLQLGADPNVGDYDGRTPLHLAASGGHLDSVKLLISKWADVNPVDRMKGTPLADSVRHGHVEVQKFLRERGGRLIVDPNDLGTALCEAAATGDLQKIRILAENDADINQCDYDGRTALHLAACCNKLSIIEFLVNIPGININPLDRSCCTPLDDALRENQQAIASILERMGGLKGQDPRMEEARRRHGEAREAAALAKAQRREEKIGMFKRQLRALDQILEIYHTLSEHLPPLFKYMNLLSVTLRSRRNTSVVDRTPHPSLHEVRTYFYVSFHQYLQNNYIKRYEDFLTLCGEYAKDSRVGDRVVIADKVMKQYLDNKAQEHIQVDPAILARCNQNFKAGLDDDLLPDNLLAGVEAYVMGELEEMLPAYFTSREYYTACRKHNGFLWRVTKLSRAIYDTSRLLLDKGVRPLLHMGDNGDLDCVPHITPGTRAAFRELCEKLEAHLVHMCKSMHVIAYLSKEVCVREAIREGHTQQALEQHSDRGVELAEGLGLMQG